MVQNRSESLETWHKVLGHCNTSDIVQVEEAVQGMKIYKSDFFDCETCILAKQSNPQSHLPDPRATRPFELIHTDLAGPIEPVAKDGFKYAMIFTGDYSGCLLTYFFKSKSDASKATEKFLADVAPYGKEKKISFLQDLIPSREIKRIRSDNGGQYISKEFKNILIKHSIKHELSAPNIAKLDIFGTICYAYLHGHRKLDSHSKRGYFNVCDNESPAYLVYYPESRTVA